VDMAAWKRQHRASRAAGQQEWTEMAMATATATTTGQELKMGREGTRGDRTG
jgi:hypothetical protein